MCCLLRKYGDSELIGKFGSDKLTVKITAKNTLRHYFKFFAQLFGFFVYLAFDRLNGIDNEKLSS